MPVNQELPDESIKQILTNFRKVVVVGLSPNSERASNSVTRYFISRGYDIKGVNPGKNEILGRPVYDSIDEVPGPLEIVQVFRQPKHIPALVDQLIPLKPKVLWLQEGITHPEAEEKARKAGITVVANHCMFKAHKRLFAREKAA